MNVAVREPKVEQATRLSVVDCDIHPTLRTGSDLKPYLSSRWQHHLETYGAYIRQALSETLAYPRMTPDVARRDAWPPNGAPPGSDLDFMREQHLDANGVEYGVLVPLRTGAGSQRNVEYGAALARAMNDWQAAEWLAKEKRLRGSIMVTPEYPEAAVAEIERCAGNRGFVQVLLPPRTDEPSGRRRYWPVYEAAVAHNLPIGMHVGGVSGQPCTAGSGPASVLHRGTSFAGAGHAGGRGQHGAGRRVRAIPDAAGGADRGRLLLGGGAVLAPRQTLEATEGRGAASQATAVRIHPRTFLVHHAADR